MCAAPTLVGGVEYLSVKNADDDRPDTSAVGYVNDSYVHLEWVKYPAPPAGVRPLEVLFPLSGPVATQISITGPASSYLDRAAGHDAPVPTQRSSAEDVLMCTA